MTARVLQFPAEVAGWQRISDHLARVRLRTEGFESTGLADEWVGLIVPGQFQSRYYTVRAMDATASPIGEVVVDIVLHERGLVTEWAVRRLAEPVVGEQVTLTQPKGSFAPPPNAEWVYLVGDLTAMPAMARIFEQWAVANPGVEVRAWVESADRPASYFPDGSAVTWVDPPSEGEVASGLAALVESLDWPAGEGYFWMAGESAQMRSIRKHLMVHRPGMANDAMGYWRAVGKRQPRAVDPTPIWRAGKAAGQTDQEIWAAYDAAREAEENQA